MRRRPALDGEEAPQRIGVGGVDTEAVDGFGRERDQSATAKRGDRIGEVDISHGTIFAHL
jgi:hypothetical protein